MTDTPIYDQLRLELSSGRAYQERSSQDSSPPKPRSRPDKAPAAAKPEADATRQPVSVWTLVNANRRRGS